MTFVLSKVVWAVLRPGDLLWLLLLASLILWRRWPGAARAVLAVAALALTLVILTPAADWALIPLEDRFPAPSLPDQVTGVIVLGGSIDASASAAAGQPILAAAPDRLIAFADLARRYPQARLLFSGGSGQLGDPGAREADWVRRELPRLGLDPARVEFERASRNTWENARFSRLALHPQPGQHWILITSAWHLPRAVGCFRAAGWHGLIPYPVDYHQYDLGWLAFDPPRALQDLALAEKEWLGLVAYRLLGRTPTLLPAPAPSR
jgi:Uncharacterized conserved protein